METGEIITLWTARGAMALYAVALTARCFAAHDRVPRATARWLWTAGLIVLLVHVGCAFHFYHDWSHAEAYRFTARATYDAVGWRWGGGLYANYALMLVWLTDAVWWWVAPQNYESRPRWIAVTIHVFITFMAINASVVFAHPAGRIWAIGFIILLSLGACFGRRR
jgi:hypothetical protein